MLPKKLFARLTKQLQIALSPEEYVALKEPFKRPSGVYRMPMGRDEDGESWDFWEAMPEYLIARCPLCGAEYTERLNTYSVEDWHPSYTTGYVYSGGYWQHVGCDHYTGVESWIHFNNVEPTELSAFSEDGEVPSVLPLFLPDEPVSRAVMHSLPICRVEEGQFVPRYALFMITYYSTDPRLLHARNAERWKRWSPDGALQPMYGFQRDWDLLKWVTAGKLCWLDLDQDDPPLQSGPMEAFPYAGIEGRKRTFRYYGGDGAKRPGFHD